MNVQIFNFKEPLFEITKSYSDDNGQMFVEGVAATTDIDLTKERMSPQVIANMAAGLINKPLRSEHGKGWDDELGKIVDAKVIDDKNGGPALWIKARLFDWSSKAKDLFHVLTNGVKKMGLSVAGKIKPGGLVEEMAENLGTWIPTYKEVDPTEVSVTDHPANINTFAMAVTKSLNDQAREMIKDYEEELKKDVTNAHKEKPSKYKDVPDEKFLDQENYKYPADEKHLMPALRYFNHDGQRSSGGYSPDKWAAMGRKLAGFLGDGYKFDASSEKVVKEEAKKSEGGEYEYMNGLVTKQLTPEVLTFIKDFSDGAPANSPLRQELNKLKETQEAEMKKAAEDAEKAKQSTSTGAVTQGDGTDSTKPVATTPPTAKKTVSLSDIESMLSTVASSLAELKATSTDSTSTDTSSTSTDKTDSGSTTSSVSKDGADGTTSTSQYKTDSSSSDGSSSSGDSTGSLESLMNSLGKAQETVKELLAKKKGSVPASSRVENDTSVPTQSDPHLSKALEEMANLMKGVKEMVKTQKEEMKSQKEESDKVIKSLVEKIDSIPNARKGKAFVMEKNLDGQQGADMQKDGEPVEKTYEEIVAIMKKDDRKDEKGRPVIGFNEIHKFQMYGDNTHLPKDYRGKYKVKA